MARPSLLWDLTPQGARARTRMARRPNTRTNPDPSFTPSFGPSSESTAIALYRRARARIACVGGRFVVLNRTQSSLVIIRCFQTLDLTAQVRFLVPQPISFSFNIKHFGHFHHSIGCEFALGLCLKTPNCQAFVK